MQNYRKIVGSEGPPRTHCLGRLATVVPAAGDPHRGAQVASRDYVPQPLDRGVIEQLMADHQHQRAASSGYNERFRLRSLETQGLLHEDVLAGGEHRGRHSEVAFSWRADCDRVDTVVAPQLP